MSGPDRHELRVIVGKLFSVYLTTFETTPRMRIIEQRSHFRSVFLSLRVKRIESIFAWLGGLLLELEFT